MSTAQKVARFAYGLDYHHIIRGKLNQLMDKIREQGLQACPTQALDWNCLDARRCLSYLTIEKKGSFSVEEAKKVGENNWIFGCDICQEVCPWNRLAKANSIAELQPTEHFLQLDEAKFRKLNSASFKTYFSDTCVERAGLDDIQRNLAAK